MLIEECFASFSRSGQIVVGVTTPAGLCELQRTVDQVSAAYLAQGGSPCVQPMREIQDGIRGLRQARLVCQTPRARARAGHPAPNKLRRPIRYVLPQ